jgi:hypothetical protein
LETATIEGLFAMIPPSVYPRNTGKKVGAADVLIAASHTCARKTQRVREAAQRTGTDMEFIIRHDETPCMREIREYSRSPPFFIEE